MNANRQNLLLEVADRCGQSIAASVLHRVTTFPDRERLIADLMKGGLESVPAQLLWGGMEEEAPAVFVMYKVLHEAYSSSPFVIRRFINSIRLPAISLKDIYRTRGDVASYASLCERIRFSPEGLRAPGRDGESQTALETGSCVDRKGVES